MKTSKYNVEIISNRPEELVLFNTLTGSFVKLDHDGILLYSDINAFINELNDEQKRIVEGLYHNGFIVDDDFDEISYTLIRREMSRNRFGTLSLTIAPTMDCNMCCPYCFENKYKRYMDKNVVNKILTYVKNYMIYYPEMESLQVTWYGGEPLMAKDIIYELSNELIKLCKNNDKKYSSFVITNGSLLDRKTAIKLRDDCRVTGAQITIDGIGESHNRSRILKNGEDSYRIIINNIQDCKDVLPIHIRVNVTRKNEDQLEELFDIAKGFKGDNDYPEIYLAPVVDYSESCSLNKTCFSFQEFADIYLKMMNYNLKLNRKIKDGDFYPNIKGLYCGAETTGCVTIDPQGYLYKCWMDVGKIEKAFGHIDKPFKITEELAKWVLSTLPEKCINCEYLPACAGGCPYERVRKGNPTCPYSYYNYREKLKLAYDIYQQKRRL